MLNRRLRVLPTPRGDLVCREVNSEFVVVDERCGKAHELAGATAEVWRAAQAGTWPALPDHQVGSIVSSLVALELVDAPPGMDRRALLRRAGVVGAVSIATIALGELPAFASTSVATTTTITLISPNPAERRHPITVSVTVKRTSDSSNVNGGTVTLTDALGNNLGSGVVVNGVASVGAVAPAATGAQVITAKYVPAGTTYSSSQGTKSMTVTTDTTAPTLTSVTTTAGGSQLGFMQAGDVIALVFSEAMDPATVPTTTTLTMSRAKGESSQAFTATGLISNTSGFQGGTAYFSSNDGSRSATGSVALSADGLTASITVGTVTDTGAVAQPGGPGLLTFTPAATLKDVNGNAITGTLSQNTQLF